MRSSLLARAALPYLAGLTLGVAPPLTGQASPADQDSLHPTIRAGSLVRMQVPGYGRGLFRATILGVTRESLRARTHPTVPVIVVPLDSVIRLQVESGSRTREVRWGVRGGALGMALGAFLGVAVDHGYVDCSSDNLGCAGPLNFHNGFDRMAHGALIGGLAGGVLGVLIGTQIREPRWRDVAPAGLRLTPGEGHSLGAEWSVRF